MNEFSADDVLHDRRISTRALWFGLFGGPTLWGIELLVNYGMASHFCFPQQIPLNTSTFSGLRIVLILVVVFAAAGTVAAGFIAFVNWRALESRLRRAGAVQPDAQLVDNLQSESNAGTPEDASDARARFMAFSGILVSALFLFLIVMNGVPVIFMPLCSYGV